MTRTQLPAVALAERLCRPQRIGVFGHRGVGKTTLLAMLYREAVGGRLPGLRLAAADARTADYLADKVLQLEGGVALPATLGETELRFHLYHQGARLDLLVMDYQGEHLTLGREEPIRDFLRDCDAVWLCLDVPVADEPASCLAAQQEVEQVVEDYLSAQDPAVPHRPVALVLTKADLLGPQVEEQVRALVDGRFSMVRHALQLHCPWHASFGVSSLGGALGESAQPFRPQPAGLDGPLTWLAQVLQAQDEARLERLWQLAEGDLSLLGRCVACFARRYPDAPAADAFRKRLRQTRRDRLRRRALSAVAGAAALLVGLWTYDVWGERSARAFAATHGDDPTAVRQRWGSYQLWHPTRHLLRPAAVRAERQLLADLDEQVRALRRDERLAELRRRADDPDADPEVVWGELQRFHADFPEHDIGAEWRQFRARVKVRAEAIAASRARAAREQRERKADFAFRELERAEGHASLAALIEQAGRFLHEHPGTSKAAEVRRRRAGYLRRLDEHDYETARDYSARHPLNFYTRRQRYQHYLDRHPWGAYVSQARTALERIAADWDRSDFRAVRDHYVAKPGDVKELRVLCRSYLAAHPQGRFRGTARELLRWGERVTAVGEYRVVLRSGEFDKSAAHMISRGLNPSVTIEVAGVRYGPSTIARRTYTPEWDYEFPRRVRWKLGDPVRIVVTDHYWWRRHVGELSSEDGDRLAMRLLSGEVQIGQHRLTFSSDFAMPKMPRIE
jgi:hypothetical protein